MQLGEQRRNRTPKGVIGRFDWVQVMERRIGAEEFTGGCGRYILS